ncbi:ferric anguibactin receptor [Acinetobacter larvae]|uniref:Ferric anguibactin receptor n=1 Tax=Acinetobacter larvae TaxID=1789224 RepID=A0A1B2M4D6_9GAMM|nr:ferric anguibactin receptor [Acinetobacter larvae]
MGRYFKLNHIAQAQVLLGLSLSLSHGVLFASTAVTAEENTLPVITLKAQANDVTAAYAGGQVASGGRVGLLGNKTIMETPFSVVSYTEQFIADRQAKDITEVIAATDPTVFSNGVTGAWSENYSIRGFNSNTSDMMYAGLVGMAPNYRSSPEMFEHIEVMKGPTALLNGMPPGGSVGGAINLLPKHAGADPLTRLTLNYMSNAQFGGHLDVARRFGEQQQLGIRFNTAYRDGEGAIKKQDKKVQLASLGLDWKTEQLRLSADLYTTEDHIDGPTRGINLAAGLDIPKAPKANTLLNPDWGFAESKDRGYVLRAEYDIRNDLQLYASFGQAKSEYKYNGTMLATLLDDQGNYKTSIGQLAFDIDKKSADVGLKGQFNTGAIQHQWAVNASYHKRTQDDYGRRTVPGADHVTNIYDPSWGDAAEFITPHISHSGARLSSYGLADTLSLAQQRIQLTLGLRRQDVKTLTGSQQHAITPAVALLLKATDQLSLYGNYIEGLSEGGRAPWDAENAFEEFEPYKTKQYEIGAKLDLGRFSHTLSAFQIKKPNGYTDPFSNIYSFGGEQRNRGIEWGFFGEAMDHVRLMGGVAYVEPKLTRTQSGINQGKIATGVAKTQAKLAAEWDLPMLQGVTLIANATAVSKQYITADNEISVAGRTLYDVGARYNTMLANHPLTLRGTLHNITNKSYWGMPLLSNLALGAPRTLMLSASIDF